MIGPLLHPALISKVYFPAISCHLLPKALILRKFHDLFSFHRRCPPPCPPPCPAEPCIPEHITAHYSLSIGQVLWDAADGAEYYIMEGATAQALEVTCNTSDTYCALYNLACGELYNLSVTANNHVCQGLSTSTETVTILTGEKTH